MTGLGGHRVKPMPEAVAHERVRSLRAQYAAAQAEQTAKGRSGETNTMQVIRGQIRQLEKMIRDQNFTDKVTPKWQEKEERARKGLRKATDEALAKQRRKTRKKDKKGK
jgi:hypothetical protein